MSNGQNFSKFDGSYKPTYPRNLNELPDKKHAENKKAHDNRCLKKEKMKTIKSKNKKTKQKTPHKKRHILVQRNKINNKRLSVENNAN